jgi:hypothetical protein
MHELMFTTLHQLVRRIICLPRPCGALLCSRWSAYAFGLLHVCRPRCHPRISCKVGLKKEEVGETDFVLSSLGPQPNHSAKQININYPPSRNLPAFFD